MKKLREIVKEQTTPYGEGIVTDTIDPSSLTDIKAYAERLNRALQPRLPIFLRNLEKRLNALGFTLGELDMDIPFGESGEEDYIIFFKSGDQVKNAYISIEYEKLAQPVVGNDDVTEDIQEYKVLMKVIETDPYEFDEIFDPVDQGTPDSLDPVNEMTTGDLKSRLYNIKPNSEISFEIDGKKYAGKAEKIKKKLTDIIDRTGPKKDIKKVHMDLKESKNYKSELTKWAKANTKGTERISIMRDINKSSDSELKKMYDTIVDSD